MDEPVDPGERIPTRSKSFKKYMKTVTKVNEAKEMCQNS